MFGNAIRFRSRRYLDNKYIAFVTPDGQIEYNRVPFGLRNAPSIFQRLMNKLFVHLKDIAAIYLDVIQKLAKMEGLIVNPTKRKFLHITISYEICEERVRPGADKAKQ